MPRTKLKQGSARVLKDYYRSLYKAFGPQFWWPGETRFEVVVGAILTQNTSWTNVEKAIARLKSAGALTIGPFHQLDTGAIAELIRPAGYYNIKAKRLKNFTAHLYSRHGGSLTRMFNQDAKRLRAELLSINGIGPETADSIILYAASQPEFVVDAYTKRIFSRHGYATVDTGYEELKSIFMDNLPKDTGLFNEYHALIVRTGKDFCRPSKPDCGGCPLKRHLD